MRTIVIVLGIAVGLSACGKSGEEAGREAARKQAEEEAAKSVAVPVRKIIPPVPNKSMLTCEQLFDPALFGQALGEPAPVTVQTKKEPDAAASCSVIRGGKRPNEAEQKALLKKNGRLG